MGLSDWNCEKCSYYHRFPSTRCSMCQHLRTSYQQMRDFVAGKPVKSSSSKTNDASLNDTNDLACDPQNENSIRPLVQSNVVVTGKENPTTTNRNINNHKVPTSNQFLKSKPKSNSNNNNNNNNAPRRNPYIRQNPYAKSNDTGSTNNNSNNNANAPGAKPPQRSQIQPPAQTSLPNSYQTKQNTTTPSQIVMTRNPNAAMNSSNNNTNSWPSTRQGTTSQPYIAEYVNSKNTANQANGWQAANSSEAPINTWTMKAARGSLQNTPNTTNYYSSSSNHRAQTSNKVTLNQNSNNSNNNQSLQGQQDRSNPFTKAATKKPNHISTTYTPGPVPFAPETASRWIYPIHKAFPSRDYQLAITNTAILHNTLVSLPTGLGKTLIAAVVLYNYYHWFPTGKVVFLAPTVPLVNQQIKACYEIMGIPVEHTALLTGKIPSSEREHLWKECRAFFCTPQTVQKDIACGRCDASKIVCLVLDEAHKATGDYAYTMVIEQAEQAGAKFRILGLSATPGPNIKAINQVVQSLRCSKVEARSEDDPNVKQYIHSRQTEYIFVKQVSVINTIERHLNNILGPLLDQIRDRGGLGRIRGNATVTGYCVMKGRDEFRQRTGSNELDGYFFAAQSLAQIRSELRQHGVGVAKMKLLKLSQSPKGYTAKIVKGKEFQELWQAVRNATSNPDNSQESTADPKLNNPKLMKLDEILTEHFKRKEACGESSRAIVFSQWRDSVQEIVSVLESAQPLLKPRHFVGQGKASSSKEGDGTKKNFKAGMKQKEQQEVIGEFKNGKYNVLVCTSIGEEGLDIGEVDLIVNYDSLRSPIRMIQRVGRTGRKRDGRVVCLISEGAEERTMQASKSAEKTLQRALKKPSNFKLQKSTPMFPEEPTLLERDMSTQKEFRMSQVGGTGRTQKSRDPSKKRTDSGASRTWKLTEEQEKERESALGTINYCNNAPGGDVSDSQFPEDLRKIFLRAQARKNPGAHSHIEENAGISRSILSHMEQSYPGPNFAEKIARPRNSQKRRNTFHQLSRKELFETIFPIERVPDLCEDVDLPEPCAPQVDNEVGYEQGSESKCDEICAERSIIDNNWGNKLVKARPHAEYAGEILGKNPGDAAAVSTLNENCHSKNDNVSVPVEITVTHPLENHAVQKVSTSEFQLPTPPESSASSSSEESSDDEYDHTSNEKGDTGAYFKNIPPPLAPLSSSNKIEEPPPNLGNNTKTKVLHIDADSTKARTVNHLVEMELDNSVISESQVLCLPTQESSSSEDESSVDDEKTESEDESLPEVGGGAPDKEPLILQGASSTDTPHGFPLDDNKEKQVILKPVCAESSNIAPVDSSEASPPSCNGLESEIGTPQAIHTLDKDSSAVRNFPSADSNSTLDEESSPEECRPRKMKRLRKVLLSQGPRDCAAGTYSKSCHLLTDTPAKDDNNATPSAITEILAKEVTNPPKAQVTADIIKGPLDGTPKLNENGISSQIPDAVGVSHSCVDLTDTPVTKVLKHPNTQLIREPSATQVLVDTPLTVSQGSSRLKSNNIGTQPVEGDIVCAVCFSAESPDNDPLLLCDGPGKDCTCSLVVHQGCYGIKNSIDNDDSWRCDPCKAIFEAQTAAFIDRESLACEICAQTSGALWLTNTTQNIPGWVHLTCKQWCMSSPGELVLCEFCGISGASSCFVEGCTSVAHPHCAASGGSLGKSWTLIKVPEKIQKGTGHRQYCSNHISEASMFLKAEVASYRCVVNHKKRVFFPNALPAVPKEQPARKRLKKKAQICTDRVDKISEDKQQNNLQCQNDEASYPEGDKETKRQRIEKRIKVRGHCKFIAYEAEIDSEEDRVGDDDEEAELRQLEEDQSHDSFINDSSQLGYTQDNLDRLGIDRLQDVSCNNGLHALHRSVDFEKERRNEFATPVLNRRMNKDKENGGWGGHTPMSAPSSEKGLGNMNFIRSVLDHHRNGGDADAIEEGYHQIAENCANDETHLLSGGQENCPNSPELAEGCGSTPNERTQGNKACNSHMVLTDATRPQGQGGLTKEQKLMIELKRREALRRRQERLQNS